MPTDAEKAYFDWIVKSGEKHSYLLQVTFVAGYNAAQNAQRTGLPTRTESANAYADALLAKKKEQKTLFGFPVIEADMPEMEDKIIVFRDFSNWAAVVNLAPPGK